MTSREPLAMFLHLLHPLVQRKRPTGSHKVYDFDQKNSLSRRDEIRIQAIILHLARYMDIFWC